MPSVRLEPWELALAAKVGVARTSFALARGLRDRDVGFAGRQWDAGVEGAAGEIAVAKALDRYWDAYVGPTTPHRPDVGPIEVRTRSKPDHELSIRPGEDDAAPYVLVRGRAPDFEVVGWITGADGKVRGRLLDNGAGQAVYFIPDVALRPLAELMR